MFVRTEEVRSTKISLSSYTFGLFLAQLTWPYLTTLSRALLFHNLYQAYHLFFLTLCHFEHPKFELPSFEQIWRRHTIELCQLVLPQGPVLYNEVERNVAVLFSFGSKGLVTSFRFLSPQICVAYRKPTVARISFSSFQ